MNDKKVLSDSQRSNENLTLFCNQVYDRWEFAVLAHLFIWMFILFFLVLLVKFISKKNKFPIRERAPRLAMVQCFTYFILVMLLYTVEVLTKIQVFQWEDKTSVSEVPFSRRFLHSLYLTIRINIYLVFLSRYLVSF